MKRIVIKFSVMMFIIANVGISQDIINETGTDGKFIVRDAEQQEAMIIEDGNVGITGELSVENMPEGNVSNPYVVWDPTDKKFKTVARIFSTLSPLSEPLETKSWHSLGYGEVDEEGNEISASVQGTAVTWNTFNTDYGYIKLGPANINGAHIYTDLDKFIFNKTIFSQTGIFASYASADLTFNTGGITRLQFVNATGNVGIGTTLPEGSLDIVSTSGALIVPRMTTTQRNVLANINGSIVYNTTTNQFNFYENGAWVIK